VCNLDKSLFHSSSLVEKERGIPLNRSLDDIGRGIPSTYVPARNIVFLSLAVAYAEVIDADAVFIGVHSTDYSGYPDCRPDFIESFQDAVNKGTKRGVEGKPIEIKTPLLYLSKTDIIEKGLEVKAPFELTWSCYKGEDKACGSCDSCLIRLKGFQEAGYPDPIPYYSYPSWYNPKRLKKRLDKD
ncbi:MAG: 7-cyano-7-deazaguanine synthase, partial [Candidatus Thermoplasmatota archaeon]